jgi:hypothetical protein
MVREGAENDLLARQCTFVHAAAYCHTRDATQRACVCARMLRGSATSFQVADFQNCLQLPYKREGYELIYNTARYSIPVYSSFVQRQGQQEHSTNQRLTACVKIGSSMHTNIIKVHKCIPVLWMYFITQKPPTCFRHSCGHLQGGTCKNINIFIVCQGHCTFKTIRFWLKLLSAVWYSCAYHLEDGQMSGRNMSMNAI